MITWKQVLIHFSMTIRTILTTVNPFNLATFQFCEFEVKVNWHPFNFADLESIKNGSTEKNTIKTIYWKNNQRKDSMRLYRYSMIYIGTVIHPSYITLNLCTVLLKRLVIPLINTITIQIHLVLVELTGGLWGCTLIAITI